MYKEVGISKIVKTLREQEGLTQDAMAKKLGLSRMSYIRLESGKDNPLSKNLEALMKTYNMDFEIIDKDGNIIV